jgi:hypothetical protein
MLHSYFIKRALTLLLAVSVVFAPLAPALATGTGSNGAHAAHVSHGGDHDAGGPVQADQPSKPCTAHAACTGPCCAGCANCFGAVSLVQPLHVHSHPVKTPVLSRLYSFVLIASPDRPPRSLSL